MEILKQRWHESLRKLYRLLRNLRFNSKEISFLYSLLISENSTWIKVFCKRRSFFCFEVCSVLRNATLGYWVKHVKHTWFARRQLLVVTNRFPHQMPRFTLLGTFYLYSVFSGPQDLELWSIWKERPGTATSLGSHNTWQNDRAENRAQALDKALMRTFEWSKHSLIFKNRR